MTWNGDPSPILFRAGRRRTNETHAAVVRLRDGRIELADRGRGTWQAWWAWGPAIAVFAAALLGDAMSDLFPLLLAAFGWASYWYHPSILSGLEDVAESTPADELLADPTTIPLADVSDLERYSTFHYAGIAFERDGIRYALAGPGDVIEGLHAAIDAAEPSSGGIGGGEEGDVGDEDGGRDAPKPAPVGGKSPRPVGPGDRR